MKSIPIPPALYPILKMGLPLLALVFVCLSLVRSSDHDVPTLNASTIGSVPSISDDETVGNDATVDDTNLERPIRWLFIDKGDGAEFKKKREMMSKINNFCDLFARDSSILTGALKENKTKVIVDWVKIHLRAIDPNLRWEAGPSASKDKFDFTITCEHQRHLQPMVDIIVRKLSKKNLPNWNFSTYRSPMPLSNFENAFLARKGHKLPRFDFAGKIDQDRSFATAFSSKDFKENNSPRDLSDASLILEMALGENNLNHWVGTVSTNQAAGKISTKGTASSSGPKDALNLIRTFEKQQNAVLAKLPTKRYWEMKAPEQHSLIRFSSKSKSTSERVTLISWLPGFEYAAPNKLFSSERFSKTGEKFCYLKAQGMGDLVLPEKREAIEKRIDKELRAAQVGCVVGAGSGTMESVYIDLCLANVNKAIPKLRELCAEIKLPKNTTLRFYDPELRYEWVGMFDETQAPQNPDRIW